MNSGKYWSYWGKPTVAGTVVSSVESSGSTITWILEPTGTITGTTVSDFAALKCKGETPISLDSAFGNQINLNYPTATYNDPWTVAAGNTGVSPAITVGQTGTINFGG